jgi:hypothetical protein
MCSLSAVALASPEALLVGNAALISCTQANRWLGVGVEWSSSREYQFKVFRTSRVLELKTDRPEGLLNGQQFVLSAPALRYGYAGYVPARSLALAFGARLTWDQDTRTLTLLKPDAPPITVQPVAITFPSETGAPLAVTDGATTRICAFLVDYWLGTRVIYDCCRRKGRGGTCRPNIERLA